MKPTQIQAYLTAMSTKANGDWKITFETQENPPPAIMDYFARKKDSLGHLLFAVQEIELENLENLPEIKQDEGKSLSQRLRNVLYIYWQQNKKPKGTFQRFYEYWMESKIEKVKDTLE